MKTISLRRFVFILSILLLILPALLAGIYNTREVQRYVRSALLDELTTHVGLVSSKVELATESLIALLQRDILLLEAECDPESQSPEEIQPILDRLAAETGSQFSLFRPDADKFVRAATTISSSVTGRSAVGTTLRKSTPAYKALAKGESYQGISPIMGIPHNTIYVPQKDEAGRVKAVLFAGIADRNFLAPVLEELKGTVIGEEGCFFVLDSEGNYILSPGGAADGENIDRILVSGEQAVIAGMIETAKANPQELNTLSYRHYIHEGDKGRMMSAVYRYIPEYDWILAASDYNDRARGTIINSLKMLMMIMAGALLVGIAVNFALNRVLRRSFLRVEQALEDVAGGDLGFSEGSGRGSFTEFKSLMNTLGERIIPKLRDTIAHIESGTAQSSSMSQALAFNIIQTISSLDRVGNSSRSISAESLQLNRLMDEAGQSSANIKGSVESLEEQIGEQSASLTQITASIEEMSASLQSVAQVAGEKLKSASDLNVRSLQGLSQVENTQSLIQQVNDDSLSIIEFLNIINDISERISLLAMNAAIEAAHAGEAGRGFAIVAGEMRSLAESTAENGRKIKETLDHTMSNMSLANQEGMSTTALIRSVNDELGSFINAFQEIVDSTSEISAGSVQILEGASSLQESTALTLAESSSINGDAGQLGFSIEETKKSSERNVAVTEDLQALLSDLNNCQREMMALGNYNSDISQSLMEKMKAFRYEKEDGETLIIDMIRSHQDWEDRIYWHLMGKKPLTVDQIAGHHDCALGRWLDSHQDGDSEENFRVLLKEHESFHDCMKSILLNGEQGTEGAGFARLIDLSHQVIRRLLALLGYEYGDDMVAESEDPVPSLER